MIRIKRCKNPVLNAALKRGQREEREREAIGEFIARVFAESAAVR